MARINLEDSIHKDNRFINLIIKLGSKPLALGELVSMWIVAQEYYLSHGFIPEDVWNEQRLNNLLIDVGLAERTLDGIRAKGQEEQFSWLKQKSEAGKKSSKKRSKKYGTAQPNGRSKKSRTGVNDSSTGANLFSPSPSPSLSSSSFLSSQDLGKKTESTKNSFCADAISFFCEQWKIKYNANYQVTGKDAGNVKRLLNDVGIDKYKTLVVSYLKMNEPVFISKRHDFTSLFMNVNKVSHFEQTGIKVSSYDLKNIELQDHNKNSWSEAYKDFKK